MTRTQREELAWAAGFFDGEGTTYFTRGKNTPRQVGISLGNTNLEAVERFQRTFGLGHIYHLPPRKPSERSPVQSRKESWHFRTRRFEHVQAVVGMLWPFMCQEKRDQAARALKKYHAVGRRCENR